MEFQIYILWGLKLIVLTIPFYTTEALGETSSALFQIENDVGHFQGNIKNFRISERFREAFTLWIKLFASDGAMFSSKEEQTRADGLTCFVCKIALPQVKNMLDQGDTHQDIINAMIPLCVAADLGSPVMCPAVIKTALVPILYIFEHKIEVTIDDICGILNPGCSTVNDKYTNWTINLDENKPPKRIRPSIPVDLESCKLLQMTDIHVDLNYLVGSDAECSELWCCRNGTPSSPENAAGPYGSPRCGIPALVYESLLDHAQLTHGKDIKMIFLTGDFVHSVYWEYSRDENQRHIEYVTQKMAEKFPSVPIYPLPGNHEPEEVNMFPPSEVWDEFDLLWVYQTVAAPFKNWLGPQQLETFYVGGYYSVKPFEDSNLLLIVINTNLCYTNNFWLPYAPIDPERQLHWLAHTLLQAERDQNIVYIAGHIPPGTESCWSIWGEKFDQIINRFEDIIIGQWYGHEHDEFFMLNFQKDSDEPISIQFAAPSALTDKANSAYKIYSIDGGRGNESTWEILDHETWIFNNSKSNEEGVASFEKLYSAKEAYGLDKINPQSLYGLIIEMVWNDTLYSQFEWNYHKGLSTRPVCNKTSIDYQDCKINLLCRCVQGYFQDDVHCNTLKSISKNL